MSVIKDHFKNFRDSIDDKAILVLIELADKSASDLRQNADFMNHTYNLRSSLGAVVFRNGMIVHENFEAVSAGSDGLEKGKQVAQNNIPSTGLGMMLVAGEDYALYVEARDNKWVISGSSMRLAKLLQNLI
ncbi:hypothetical protein [Sphingobacterium sp. 1.A.5]|uniref:hypothetical protein n=1 Tax=Sphingobacterium sp. 1.A.5 TaxID=2044604 RepID=UPI001181C125|nr:hypothetical protein [Sphingobacterium sp. 1.A.5]